MWTVFKCVLPDGKVFIGKTKRNLKTHVSMMVKACETKQDSIFMWALKKANGRAQWLDYGQFLLTSDAIKLEQQLMESTRSCERQFGYNYKIQNGTNWQHKGKSMEKSSVSRLKARFTNLSKNIEDEKLRKKVDSVVDELEIYLKKTKDSKR